MFCLLIEKPAPKTPLLPKAVSANRFRGPSDLHFVRASNSVSWRCRSVDDRGCHLRDSRNSPSYTTSNIYLERERERDVAILAERPTERRRRSYMAEKLIAALRESFKKFGEVKACSLEDVFCF